ncbi:MAG: hypothetical protein ABFD94_13440 [Armatimonadia bacterium]
MSTGRVSERVAAFGWVFHRITAQAGSWFDIAVSRATSVKGVGVHALYTQGLVHCTNVVTGQRMPDRTPGTLSGDLPDIDVGIYRYAAIEASEWWCIDRTYNGGTLPPVTALPLSAGQHYDGLVLVCTGTDAGRSFDGYTAAENCLALAVAHAL